MKWFVVLGALSFLLGIVSPLPIWPGPLLIRHIPPGIISAVLMIAACLGARNDGSKTLGGLSIVYGSLASLAGVFFIILFVTSSPGFQATSGWIIMLGGISAIILGFLVIFLGRRIFKLKKT